MEYKIFLERLKRKIDEKDFGTDLKKFINIDKKYYEKQIDRKILNNIIKEYEQKEIVNSKISTVQILTIGNPEIVFRMGIEAIRNNLTDIFISISDFCLAQNKFIVSFFSKFFAENNLKINIILDNLTNEDKIIENSKKYELTLSISDSYRYYYYKDSVQNIKFYPYSIFEVYSDDSEFEKIKKAIYMYSSLNGYEMVNIDQEIEFEDVIKLINNDGYGFASLLLSKDIEKQKKFKSKIKSKNIIINENPLKKINFELKF